MHDPDLTFRAFRFMASGFLGGFAEKLALAWFAADSGNKARVEAAFPELLERAKTAAEATAAARAVAG